MLDSFKSTSKTEWLNKVEKDLKGKSIDDLKWLPFSDFEISPFNHKDDIQDNLSAISNQNEDNSWLIGETIDCINGAKKANELAIAALESGVNSLRFQNADYKDFKILLKDINLEWINSHFQIATGGVKALYDFAKEKNYNPENLRCSFWQKDPESGLAFFPKAKFIQIKPGSGSDETQNIATQLHKANLVISNKPEFNTVISFYVNLTDSFYLNIVKIRALRSLWQFIQLEYNISFPICHIIAYTAKSENHSDVDMNRIKAGNHAASAVIAGVDELFIIPSDRITRNVQHLLQLESHMARVKDPAAGSYFFESLTDQFAERVWTQFQNMC